VFAVAFGLLGAVSGAVCADERHETWQKGRPYTLAGYGTHDYGGVGSSMSTTSSAVG